MGRCAILKGNVLWATRKTLVKAAKVGNPNKDLLAEFAEQMNIILSNEIFQSVKTDEPVQINKDAAKHQSGYQAVSIET